MRPSTRAHTPEQIVVGLCVVSGDFVRLRVGSRADLHVERALAGRTVLYVMDGA